MIDWDNFSRLSVVYMLSEADPPAIDIDRLRPESIRNDMIILSHMVHLMLRLENDKSAESEELGGLTPEYVAARIRAYTSQKPRVSGKADKKEEDEEDRYRKWRK